MLIYIGSVVLSFDHGLKSLYRYEYQPIVFSINVMKIDSQRNVGTENIIGLILYQVPQKPIYIRIGNI